MGAPTWEKAVDIYVALRERGTPVDDADIIIAANCIVSGYVLTTNNTRHFKNISGLRLTNWK
jgi:predicted nucleic acid-binding protein